MIVLINPSGQVYPDFAAVTRVGLDLAENTCQVHTVDAKDEIVVPQLTRGWLIALFAELPSGS
jgi:hypothetical protein